MGTRSVHSTCAPNGAVRYSAQQYLPSLGPTFGTVLLNPAGFFFCMAGGAPVDPPLDYDQQIALLKERGLTIADEDFVRRCLAHCNYYRLISYRRTLAGAGGKFSAGTTFDDLWKIYVFDRSIRRLLLEALKQVEISVRAQWTYQMAMVGGSHAYEDPSLHVQSWKGVPVAWHAVALSDLDDDLARNEDRRKHGAKEKSASGRPPIWAVSEAMSFGLLSRFYSSVLQFKIRGGIAKCYGLHADAMKSFLEHAVYLRNLSAHHLSVWDRRMTVTMAIPIASPKDLIPAFNPVADSRIYNSLVMLVHVTRMIDPGTDWPDRMRVIVAAATEPMRNAMGFPAEWAKYPIWNALPVAAVAGPVANR